MTATPAAELRQAAQRLRVLAEDAATSYTSDLHGHPWQVEECAVALCPCIVAQVQIGDDGKQKHARYIADAETPALAAYIAAVHPAVGLALAAWLENTAIKLHHSTHPDWQEVIEPHALAVARQILGTPAAVLNHQEQP